MSEKLLALERMVNTSKDELKKRKKMILAQQEIINNVAKGKCHRCPLCEKLFVERSFLEDHFRRKHPGCDIAMLGSPGGQADDLSNAKKRIQELEKLLKGN